MKEKLLVIAATLLVFVAGIGLGLEMGRHRTLPPPFWGPEEAGRHAGDSPRLAPEQIDRFRQRVEALQPPLTSFQKGFDAIEADFSAKFEALLTPEQMGRRQHREGPIDWTSDFNRFAAGRIGAPEPPFGGPPGTHERPGRAFLVLLRIVMYEPVLRIMTDKYSLTTDQQAKTKVLLEARRKAFLALVDRDPLPLDGFYFAMRDLGLIPPPTPDPLQLPPPKP